MTSKKSPGPQRRPAIVATRAGSSRHRSVRQDSEGPTRRRGIASGFREPRRSLALPDAVAQALVAKRNPIIEAARAEGRTEGKIEDLLMILDARGLVLSAPQRALIENTRDRARLDAWIRRAVRCSDAAELFQGELEHADYGSCSPLPEEKTPPGGLGRLARAPGSAGIALCARSATERAARLAASVAHPNP